jgi:hypothetical protein
VCKSTSIQYTVLSKCEKRGAKAGVSKLLRLGGQAVQPCLRGRHHSLWCVQVHYAHLVGIRVFWRVNYTGLCVLGGGGRVGVSNSSDLVARLFSRASEDATTACKRNKTVEGNTRSEDGELCGWMIRGLMSEK